MSELQIIAPPRADQSRQLDFGLVSLTEAIAQIAPDRVAAGLLGGEFGYGADYENDVFMMHHYCWCEEETCPWCGGCSCAGGSMEFVDRRLVPSWYDATRGWLPPMPMDVAEYGSPEYERARAAWDAAIKDRDARVTILYRPIKHTCGHGWAINQPRRRDFGPPQSAPNFWHKESGLRVWWYKWIGRDMETFGNANVAQIMRECMESLPQAPETS